VGSTVTSTTESVWTNETEERKGERIRVETEKETNFQEGVKRNLSGGVA
jgi:hypothetical protein